MIYARAQGDVSNGTSNIAYLLDDELQTWLHTVTPSSFEGVFGPGDESCYIPSKGYTDPEWYWEAADGNVWGIGWRWGSPRLRGRVRIEDESLFPDHPSKESARDFIEYLQEAFENG